jgi:hypothetical protein
MPYSHRALTLTSIGKCLTKNGESYFEGILQDEIPEISQRIAWVDFGNLQNESPEKPLRGLVENFI